MMRKILDSLKQNKKYEDLTNKNVNKVDSCNINDSSIPVENYNGVLQFICDNIIRSVKLTTFLKKELTELFGKHNTRFKSEFYYYVWIVEFDGEIFEIFTAKGKGTQFSIVAEYGDDKSEICINFLRKMEQLLDDIETISIS